MSSKSILSILALAAAGQANAGLAKNYHCTETFAPTGEAKVLSIHHPGDGKAQVLFQAQALAGTVAADEGNDSLFESHCGL